MKLSRQELARCFQVSARTVTNWRINGMPCVQDGVRPQFEFEDAAAWLWQYSLFGFANYEEPDIVIANARRRAKAIVRARAKRP